MGKKIVVLGSLNMDVVVSADRAPLPGETIHGKHVLYLPGGKGANKAVGIKKLGGKVQMVGAVGNDMFGNQITEQLKRYNLDTNYISTVSTVPTGIANIVHLPNDNSIIVIPGANGECTPNQLQSLEQLVEQADILLMQLEIPLETVAFALKIAKKNQVETILNPAPATQLSDELLELVDYITPNETELEVLVGSKVSFDKKNLEKVFEKWHDKHQTKLIVTLGEKGCAYWCEDQLMIVPAYKVNQVVDTTGAGDAFNAALAYGLSQDWPIANIVAFAVTGSALAVTKFGAQEGMPTKQEVEEA
ncbi:ribokinase [Aquibacillus rhizosphaerae]|uniref:Ribokinase n=1 Tax=Aquibacillus rhizosphaerae TaxID=3051431 RepID=A0ABT7L7J5_9BACI|nr:ribokinase [Aquibacillus sp. LR5S19]MDL4841830.1 ribokinase [Aquibacillus sp. LR5S19]